MKLDDLHSLLEYQVNNACSDLHLYSDNIPYLRTPSGDLENIEGVEMLTHENIENLASEILSAKQLEVLKTQKDFELSSTFSTHGRFRVTFFYDMQGMAIVFRAIPDNTYTLEQLGIPSQLNHVASLTHGLVLVTGPNGSGKSTTMASLVNEINETRKCNIITIEDPIEYIHESKKSFISQREVGSQVLAFKEAGKHIFRQDVNVVVVGELRDFESFTMALDIAETGHLVISTMHAESTTSALSRIIGIFPDEKQNLIRTKLSFALRAIISQKLITRKDQAGRALACEYLVPDDVVRNMIANNDISKIRSMIEHATLDSSLGFSRSILELYKKGVITKEQAIANIENHEDFSELRQVEYAGGM
ncbi:MAG: PilT/PilU family type 4a pilus ATPase [Candidatus Gracilibacteria bacterium]|jgi:twitching motility protein PilT|nr:PilT/PilU family type 4a pilus ATPase [Candidatus Gracilibacteria bacterium]